MKKILCWWTTAAALALPMEGKLITAAVPYVQGGVELEGYLSYDDAVPAAKTRPGILLIHEWWGLGDYVKGRADQLAHLGYVAFAADMYGKGTYTTDAKKAGALAGQFYGKPLMAERAQAGLDQLVKTGLVNPDQVVAIGYCFGGSTALALGFSGAPLAGVVTFHAGLIPVPPGAAGATKAKFLICHGALDPFAKKEDLDAFLAAMNAGKFDYEFISYAGAVHAFTNPEADRLAQANGLQGIGYNAAADRRSWANFQTFLTELFGTAGAP